MSTFPFVRLACVAAATPIILALAGQPSQAASAHGTHAHSTTSSSTHEPGDGHATSAPTSDDRGARSGPAPRRTIDLTVDRVTIDTGRFRETGVGFNGASPGPVLRFKEGEEVTLNVTNTMDVPTSIHWHGLILPAEMDGVPTISYDGIAPGETFSYRFPIKQAGTYWYHSHSGFQEPDGAYGAIVIEPRDSYRHVADRDYVVQLTDAHPHSGEHIMRNLKQMPDYYNRQQRTLFDFFDDVRDSNLNATLADRAAWGEMRMMPTDIEDVQGYTPLINGESPGQNWTGLFGAGERVRLRFINSSAMTYFDVRIPGLKMTVIQADGNDVQTVEVDELRIAVAETYDVIVEPTEARAYTIFAESMGRAAYARGTLTPRAGMTAQVPALREPPLLTMADMGMAHGEMNHGDMSGQGLHDTARAAAARNGAEMDRAGPGNQGGHAHAVGQAATAESGTAEGHAVHARREGEGKAAMTGMSEADIAEATAKSDLGVAAEGGMDHAGMNPSETNHGARNHAGSSHGATMRSADAGDPFYAPGSGLAPEAANEGRVLSYADLRAARPLYAHRPATREIELRLTGNMERYIWSVNGVKYGEAEPIRLKYGERVRFKFVNGTMMVHPMHLHGMWSILDVGAGEINPIKHVVSVAPGTTVYMETEVDAPGAWAFHCHLSYHAAAGMFRKVVVEGAPQTAQLGGQ